MNKDVKKKIGSIVLASSILLSSNIVLAKENNYVSTKNISQANKEIVVTYNNEKLEFDQAPILEDNRTKVPFRKVFESMGCIVYYNNSENKIMALTKQGDILTHTIGTKEMDLNGEVITFDSPSTIVNDRTLVPLRAVAEALDAKVEWKEKENTVKITKKEEQIDGILKEVMMCVTDDNYNPKDTKRYVEYRKKNKDMDIKQVIMDVNIDLDKELEYMRGNGIKDLWHHEANIKDVDIIENPDDFFVYINKFNALPKTYESTNLEHFDSYYTGGYKDVDKRIVNDLRNLINDARNQGLKMELLKQYEDFVGADSSFFQGIVSMRFSNDEAYVYNRFPQPQFSETRTGLSVVFNESALSYNEQLIYLKETVGLLYYEQEDYIVGEPTIIENKKSEQWLRENAYKYGFIERYPKDKSKYTRYEYSPNFYRYVGIEVAKQMHDEGLCYDEYYGKYLNPIVNEREYYLEKDSTQKVLQKY